MNIDGPTILSFLEPQIRDHGGQAEIDDGLWLLFAAPASDGTMNSIADTLLREAGFPHNSGLSEDDEWMLYYVNTDHRAEAIHWLADSRARAAGEIRPVSPTHRELIADLPATTMPHRIAQQFAELAAHDEISVGVVREPAIVRGCLDRLHQREPLFFSAFHTLLTHHLVDMIVLHRQLITEDVELKNEIVRGGLSHDPFLQTRQDAAAGIRTTLIKYHIISPLDQQKNTAIANPYASYMDVASEGDQLKLPLEGSSVKVTRRDFLKAIHATRHRLYCGENFSTFDTQSPWMTDAIAYPFRFIKQRLSSHRELTPLAALYMLERAV